MYLDLKSLEMDSERVEFDSALDILRELNTKLANCSNLELSSIDDIADSIKARIPAAVLYIHFERALDFSFENELSIDLVKNFLSVLNRFFAEDSLSFDEKFKIVEYLLADKNLQSKEYYLLLKTARFDFILEYVLISRFFDFTDLSCFSDFSSLISTAKLSKQDYQKILNMLFNIIFYYYGEDYINDFRLILFSEENKDFDISGSLSTNLIKNESLLSKFKMFLSLFPGLVERFL